MTCLTVTPDSAGEAVDRGADLIVTHHPIPFRPLNRITAADVSGRLLLKLIRAGIAVISPHTAFDSAAAGINQMLAEKFELPDPRPLVPACEFDPSLGAARIARPVQPVRLSVLLNRAKTVFDLPAMRFVGDPDQRVSQIALACGSGGSFLDAAVLAGCDCLVTGEATFHSCLAARSAGMALLLLGHHNSERFAVEALAGVIASHFPDTSVWSSTRETDPVRYA